MTGRLFIKAAVLSCITLLAVAIVGQDALAKRPDRTPPAEILSVYADLGAYELTIDGYNFDAGTTSQTPLVFLAGVSLGVDVFSNVQIIAFLPDGIADGDYLLEVVPGGSSSAAASWDLTIGAVGPAGPEGPEGPQGPTGLANWQRTRHTPLSNRPANFMCEATVCCATGTILSGGVDFPNTAPRAV